MTLLIADDEIAVREGLRVLVDWRAFGFDAIAESTDGNDAFIKMVGLQPELTLLDIKMPKLSGVEAAERARKAGYAGKIVILSGYSEFKYAQSALRFGADAYLLKPVDEDELAAVVREANGKLERSAHRSIPAENAAERFRDAVPEMLRTMETDYHMDLTLDALAARLGYNSAYLGKLFRSRTGESFNARLDKIRVRKAEALLSDGGLKVYEVCERLGYGSLDYFYKKFKAQTGMSPSEYRRSIGVDDP